ncbi:CocE/NonD family hydrolase [Amycolatopsis sp. NPDC001319]|uniref:CocE/NonD family hydrolase n=1 Tax=unclassified Amycolatopsis TaxID=2618356 RepID=UPI0036A8BD2E
MRRSTAFFGLLVLFLTQLVSPAQAAAWSPGPAQYAVTETNDVPVTMADGTVIKADVLRPDAPGTYPVLLAQTPYGRADLHEDLSYFVQRGYVAVITDVRGTGGSGGQWVPFAPIERQDGAALVRWAAALPGSDGNVGLNGGSYVGINQLTTAAAVGPNSPLKAIFPVVAGNDLYRDLAAMGGLPNAEFMPLWELLTGLRTVTQPVLDALNSGSPAALLAALTTELQHLGGLGAGTFPLLTGEFTGGEQAFDEDYWQSRNPANVLGDVVANGIPAYLVGGWNDLFQRGALMNYAALQNAWAGRPVTAPMAAGQTATSRYQLLMGPWYHDPTGEIDLHPIELAWYDHWLKGVDTGITDTTKPLHANVFGTDTWVDTTTYPFTGAQATTYYLGGGRTGTAPRSANDGTLTTSPGSGGGTDWITWTPTSSTCTRSTAQWLGGFLPNPACDTTNLDREHGPGSLVYTSAPLTQPSVLAGPITASISAQANTLDTTWVVTVTDVGPDGSSKPLTEGALIGSQRETDSARSWYSSDGKLLMPYHPYTRQSEKWVVPNEITRYDVEVFPTFAQLAAGHRIRVVLTTADTPHLTPTLTQLPRLLGGIYQVKTPASSITLPLAPLSAFTG